MLDGMSAPSHFSWEEPQTAAIKAQVCRKPTKLQQQLNALLIIHESKWEPTVHRNHIRHHSPAGLAAGLTLQHLKEE